MNKEAIKCLKQVRAQINKEIEEGRHCDWGYTDPMPKAERDKLKKRVASIDEQLLALGVVKKKRKPKAKPIKIAEKEPEKPNPIELRKVRLMLDLTKHFRQDIRFEILPTEDPFLFELYSSQPVSYPGRQAVLERTFDITDKRTIKGTIDRMIGKYPMYKRR